MLAYDARDGVADFDGFSKLELDDAPAWICELDVGDGCECFFDGERRTFVADGSYEVEAGHAGTYTVVTLEAVTHAGLCIDAEVKVSVVEVEGVLRAFLVSTENGGWIVADPDAAATDFHFGDGPLGDRHLRQGRVLCYQRTLAARIFL